MGAGQIFFGTVSHPVWVQSPAGGLSRRQVGYSDEVSFQDGGIWVEESAGSHAEFSLDFPVAVPAEASGVEAFTRFANREFGSGYLYWVDPMFADSNLFNPSWAAPGLIGEGWKNHGGSAPTFAATGANTFGKPATKATWAVTTAPNEVFGRAFTFLVPPGYTLHLGGSGAVTGDGALVVLPAGGTAAAIVLTADDAAPAFSSTVSGDVASSATVYMTRTAETVSDVTVTALWAQVLPTGQAPVIARHLPGRGTTGMRFRGKAMPEVYISAADGSKLVGMSAELVEVEMSA